MECVSHSGCCYPFLNIVVAVVGLVVVVIALWLFARLVRAVEKITKKGE